MPSELLRSVMRGVAARAGRVCRPAHGGSRLVWVRMIEVPEDGPAVALSATDVAGIPILRGRRPELPVREVEHPLQAREGQGVPIAQRCSVTTIRRRAGMRKRARRHSQAAEVSVLVDRQAHQDDEPGHGEHSANPCRCRRTRRWSFTTARVRRPAVRLLTSRGDAASAAPTRATAGGVEDAVHDGAAEAVALNVSSRTQTAIDGTQA